MTDNIASRVFRLIAGGAHALLDKAENLAPDAIMAQSIREIEQVVGEVRGDLGKVEAAKHLIVSQIAKLDAEHHELTQRVEAAINHDRDDLAEAGIGRQADIEDLRAVLQKSLGQQLERVRELEGYIVALLAKKREFEQTLSDYQAAASSPAPAPVSGSDRQSRVDDAESAFGRVLSQQFGLGGIPPLGAAADAAKLKELAEMQRRHRIAERLAAIKASQSRESR